MRAIYEQVKETDLQYWNGGTFARSAYKFSPEYMEIQVVDLDKMPLRKVEEMTHNGKVIHVVPVCKLGEALKVNIPPELFIQYYL